MQDNRAVDREVRGRSNYCADFIKSKVGEFGLDLRTSVANISTLNSTCSNRSQ